MGEKITGAINPLDGRYYEKTRALAPYFSEEALMKYTPGEIKTIRNLYEKFGDAAYQEIKKTEETTNHDVKAVEYFLKEKLSQTTLKDSAEWIHFGLTSEDTN